MQNPLCLEPFFGLQSCEVSGYIHTALSTILGKRAAVLVAQETFLDGS